MLIQDSVGPTVTIAPILLPNLKLIYLTMTLLVSLGSIPSKSLNVYDIGMKMYTSQPITALLERKS